MGIEPPGGDVYVAEAGAGAGVLWCAGEAAGREDGVSVAAGAGEVGGESSGAGEPS